MTSSSLNSQLLQDFMQGFYGYGNYQGRYWFIGMEEGGGNTVEEIARRLAIWERMGCKELEDVAEYHFQIQMPYFFQDPVKLQSTWNKLIRILLSAEGKTPDTDMVRAYQKNHLGRSAGNSCLLEVLPLPSPSTQNWHYFQFSGLPILRTREIYQQKVMPWRIQHIRQRIEQHQPKVVVFYGMGYREYWQRIVQTETREDCSGYLIGKKNRTVFVITKHPVATGVTNEYFHEIGRKISSLSQTV